MIAGVERARAGGHDARASDLDGQPGLHFVVIVRQ